LKSFKLLVPGSKSQSHWIAKGINRDKIDILHSTVNTLKFKPDTFAEKQYDFIYVGRFSEEKNLVFLIKAFNEVFCEFPDSKLIMVGDGPQFGTIEKLTSHYAIRDKVVFTGFRTEVLEYLHKSKFIVLPSIMEGLPTAIMEGMSAGCIPIASNVGNLSDIIVNQETGFLFTSNSKDEFVTLLKSLIVYPENELRRISSNAQEIIKKSHSHFVAIEKWSSIISNISS
jgi:glycosyltransferase involved in cell wall biosynthesis